MKICFPIMLRSTHEAVRRENFELRGALSHANAELRKHRTLLAQLRDGNEQAIAAVQKVFVTERK